MDGRRSRPSTRPRRLLALRRRRRRAAVHRERDQRARLYGADRVAPTSRTRSTSTCGRRRTDAVNPDGDRHQGGRALPARDRAGGGAARLRLRLRGGHARDVRSPTSTKDVRAAPRRGRRVLRRPAGRIDDRRPQRAAPGVRRPALEQAVLLLRRPRWLEGDPAQPPPPGAPRTGRNAEWRHLNNADVISMPDKWEYPWYAAWDLAFHCVPLALVDPSSPSSSSCCCAREWYMHPNGQLPAYEWAFGDVNPPVHAWAAWRVYKIDRTQPRATRRPRPSWSASSTSCC